MQKIGNLFELAEKQLQKEVQQRKIPCYTGLDIIETAILIRKWLDKHNNIKNLIKLTNIEKKKLNNEKRHQYYLQKGR